MLIAKVIEGSFHASQHNKLLVINAHSISGPHGVLSMSIVELMCDVKTNMQCSCCCQCVAASSCWSIVGNQLHLLVVVDEEFLFVGHCFVQITLARHSPQAVKSNPRSDKKIGLMCL